MAESSWNPSVLISNYVFAPIGLNSPLKRFIVVAALAGLVEYAIKPFWSFNSDGSPKKWAVLNRGEIGSTYTPIGSAPILLGVLSSFYF